MFFVVDWAVYGRELCFIGVMLYLLLYICSFNGKFLFEAFFELHLLLLSATLDGFTKFKSSLGSSAVVGFFLFGVLMVAVKTLE